VKELKLEQNRAIALNRPTTLDNQIGHRLDINSTEAISDTLVTAIGRLGQSQSTTRKQFNCGENDAGVSKLKYTTLEVPPPNQTCSMHMRRVHAALENI
jgi:hypothetical protein